MFLGEPVSPTPGASEVASCRTAITASERAATARVSLAPGAATSCRTPPERTIPATVWPASAGLAITVTPRSIITALGAFATRVAITVTPRAVITARAVVAAFGPCAPGITVTVTPGASTLTATTNLSIAVASESVIAAFAACAPGIAITLTTWAVVPALWASPTRIALTAFPSGVLLAALARALITPEGPAALASTITPEGPAALASTITPALGALVVPARRASPRTRSAAIVPVTGAVAVERPTRTATVGGPVAPRSAALIAGAVWSFVGRVAHGSILP